MRRSVYRSVATLMIALTAACASGGASTTSSSGQNRSVITQNDLSSSGTETAYDVIQRLRPEYLRVKPSQKGYLQGVGDAPPPTVIVAGQPSGNLDDLRHIPAVELSRIRYYNIEEAKRTFGMQYEGGAIELTYKTH
jgi:hypothetical protein